MFWPNACNPKFFHTLICGVGDDKVQYVLWFTHNFSIVEGIKNVVLCCKNNLNQDLPESITRCIIKVASTFKSKYGSISIFICGCCCFHLFPCCC